MSDLWPLFELRVTTPRLELRYIDDELGHALARLAAQGIHDPDFMPFSVPWTDTASPQLERNTLQYYWRSRAEITPASWTVDLAVLSEGEVVGSIGLMSHDFPVLRQFETGSWLGRVHQGKGIGTEMRVAALHLGFVGFGAEWATTGAFEDNVASLAVTRKLGYTPAGRRRAVSRGAARTLEGYEMHREHFLANVRRDDVTLHGADACRVPLGL